MPAKPETLYDTDFFQWTQQSAELLRQRRFDELDVEHIAEEIEDMGKRDRREVENRMAVVIAHMLKLDYQPERKTKSWLKTVGTQQIGVERVLEDSPSLRRMAAELLPKAYRIAVRRAALETGLDPRRFPTVCPYTLERILGQD